MRLFINIQGIAVTLVFIYSFVMISSGQDRKSESNFEDKEVFTGGFPKTLSFRNDNLGKSQSYDYWESIHIRFNSITKKYLTEEGNISPVIAQFANTFEEAHPEKLVLLHLNGEARSVKEKEIHEMFFPGHWVYEAGTTLSEDINETQTVISVQSAKPFSETAYTVHSTGGTLPHDLIIVELDQEGKRLWYQSEYAKIEKVDYTNNKITVKRGQYFSVPRSFEKGKTCLAPLPGASWATTDMLQWYFNLSSVCPADTNGKTCSDVLLDYITNHYKSTGMLKNVNGIGFDVNYFNCRSSKWDVNNDGVADKGIVEGKDVWRIGDWKFLRDLRDTMGSEFILTSDGWQDANQRAVGVFNGMESEGLCRYNDAFRQISRTINQHTYWNMHNSAKYKFSYITSKIKNDVDARLSTQLHRMGLALATCLGIAYAYDPLWVIPEVTGGSLGQNNWLGQPVSDLIYPVQQTGDLLDGKGVTMNTQLVNMFDFTNAWYRVEDSILYIKGKQPNPYADLSVPGPSVILQQDGDLIVFFEVKAIDGFHDFLPADRVPRKINIKINATPSYTLPGETSSMIAMHNDLSGFMGTPGFTPVNYYFRKVGKSGTPVRLTFEVEEQGEFAIRNLRIYSGPCTMAREYQNGVVLINPSYDDQSFNLNTLFPGSKIYKRITAVEAGSGLKMHGDFNEILAYNSGETVANTSDITVPALNALFLIKENDPGGINDDLTDADDIILYPNPCKNGSVMIKLPDGRISGKISVQLADTDNKVVIRKYYTNQDEMNINLSGLVPGIYIVNVMADRFMTSKKLVVL